MMDGVSFINSMLEWIGGLQQTCEEYFNEEHELDCMELLNLFEQIEIKLLRLKESGIDVAIEKDDE